MASPYQRCRLRTMASACVRCEKCAGFSDECREPYGLGLRTYTLRRICFKKNRTTSGEQRMELTMPLMTPEQIERLVREIHELSKNRGKVDQPPKVRHCPVCQAVTWHDDGDRCLRCRDGFEAISPRPSRSSGTSARRLQAPHSTPMGLP